MSGPGDKVRKGLIAHAIMIAGAQMLLDFKFDEVIKDIWAKSEGMSADEIKRMVGEAALQHSYGNWSDVSYEVEQSQDLLDDHGIKAI